MTGLRLTALVLATVAGSCSSPTSTRAVPGSGAQLAPSGWRLLDEGAVRPTLEEVFLEPPISGEAPRIDSVSADGAFAVIRWRGPEDAQATPRLVPTDGSGRRPAGTPLAQLLPAPEESEGEVENLQSAWSRRGHRLAVARGHRVWMVDPGTGAVALLAAWEARPEASESDGPDGPGSEGDGAQAPAEPSARPRSLGAVSELRFSPDDLRLRVGDGRELFELFVPSGLPDRPFTLEEATWWSADLEQPAQRLLWSRDLQTAVGLQRPPRPEASPGAHVWHVGERRAVELEGVGDGEGFEGARLSPDGRFLFALEVDRSDDPEPTEVPDYLSERVTHREGRRKLADDRPSPTRLWIWDTRDGSRRRLEFQESGTNGEPQEAGAGEGESAPRDRPRALAWAPAGEPRLLVERLSEDFRDLELWLWTEAGFRRLHRERDDKWIGGPARGARWTADGRAILLGSEALKRSTTRGRNQLFRLDPGDGSLRQLTTFGGEVSSFTPLADGGVLVRASDADPARRGFFLIDGGTVDGPWGTPPHRYAVPDGWTGEGRAARDGGRVVFRSESLLTPAEIHAADFAASHRLTATVPTEFETVDWVRPQRLTVRAPDGATVYAHVYLPPEVELDAPGPPRAAVVFAHGAGYLQNVTDSMTRYPLNAMFHSRLARLGYPVIDVDYRGSAGYGRDFRTDVQGHLGGQDLDDIHLVVDELVERGLVDPRRVGIYGGSYGGFLTLMALFTAPERWAVGCALRSVTDWRTYTPGYTQPRLGRPSLDPEAYRRSSPIDWVDGLEDPLLVLHGMLDSNVFAQDSVRLIEALIDAGKDFDAMLYPSQGHGFRDGEHWLDEYRRIERYLIDHLGPPLFPDSAEAVVWLHASWVHGVFWVPGSKPGDPPTPVLGTDVAEAGFPFQGLLAGLGSLLEGVDDEGNRSGSLASFGRSGSSAGGASDRGGGRGRR